MSGSIHSAPRAVRRREDSGAGREASGAQQGRGAPGSRARSSPRRGALLADQVPDEQGGGDAALVDELAHTNVPGSRHEKRWQDVKAIVHMGAISSTTEPDADRIVHTNFGLSRDLYRWCADRQRRFIYASSAATYGAGEQGFADRHDLASLAALRPLNAYGWSKALFDQFAARQAAESAGLILLITGAGGSFGMVLRESGVGETAAS
mgnify:CR=1 FL=1